jgi:succinate dehydrogenase / fumarate reductase membrane anchor subunit
MPVSKTHALAKRDLGSAKSGLHHWLAQRFSAVGLILLSLWLVASLLDLAFKPYGNYVYWIRNPLNASALILFLGFGFYHSALGLQTVIEDYVHTPWKRWTTLLVVQGLSLTFAVASIFSVLWTAFAPLSDLAGNS